MTDILVNLGTCFWGWISVMNVKSLRISAVRGHCITPTLLAQGTDLASAYIPGHPDHHTEFPPAPRTHRTLSRQPPDSRPPWNHAHPARPLCPFFRKPFPLWYRPFKTQCVIVSESRSPGGELQGGSSVVMFLSSLTHPVMPQIFIEHFPQLDIDMGGSLEQDISLPCPQGVHILHKATGNKHK